MRVAARLALLAVFVSILSVTGRAAGVVVEGLVVDPAGSPIPGATVELVSVARTYL